MYRVILAAARTIRAPHKVVNGGDLGTGGQRPGRRAVTLGRHVGVVDSTRSDLLGGFFQDREWLSKLRRELNLLENGRTPLFLSVVAENRVEDVGLFTVPKL